MIQIENLVKRYDNFSLHNLSFSVEKGCVTGFVGQNGAGKTTVIKSILNLIPINEGKITVDGFDSIKDSRELKNHIGVVLDEGIFYENMPLHTIRDIYAGLYEQWDQKAYERYIEKFNLGGEQEKKVKDLSKGMRMKFSLALAFSHNAKIFIMDEPTSGLDPIVRNEMLEIMVDIMKDEEKCIFFSTHITSDLDKVANKLIFIEQGSIFLSGEKDQILNSHKLLNGALEELTDEIRTKSIAVHELDGKFTALINSDSVNLDNASWEKPSIEDILRFYVQAKGGKSNG